MSECVDCHGSHAIAVPDHGLFATACGRCHAPDTPAATRARELATLFGQTSAALAAADDDLTRVARQAPTVARYRPRLEQARGYLVEALPLQHALDVARVEDLTRTARSVADEVRRAAHAAEQEHGARWLLLAVTWAFLLFVVVVAILRRRELRGADGAGS
jgi:hypothetical protein